MLTPQNQKHQFQPWGLITLIYVKTYVKTASPMEEKKKSKKQKTLNQQKKPLLYFFLQCSFHLQDSSLWKSEYPHKCTSVHTHVKKYATDTTLFPFKMLVTSFWFSLCWKRRRFCSLLFVPGFTATRNSDQQFFMMQHNMEKRTCLVQKSFPCVEKAGINGLQHICKIARLLLNSY